MGNATQRELRLVVENQWDNVGHRLAIMTNKRKRANIYGFFGVLALTKDINFQTTFVLNVRIFRVLVVIDKIAKLQNTNKVVVLFVLVFPILVVLSFCC